MGKRILVVDDSLYMQTIIKEALESNGFSVVKIAGDGESAIDAAIETKPDLITLDNILPDMLGLDVIKALKEEKIEAKILMVSAVGQQSVINTGMALGADGYLVKPFTTDQLIEQINTLLA